MLEDVAEDRVVGLVRGGCRPLPQECQVRGVQLSPDLLEELANRGLRRRLAPQGE